MTTGRQHRNRNTNDPNTASAGGRRTIAWYIARLPGGRIALALQYGHLRTTVSSGYSNRARHGLRRVLDIETARAIAYLQHLDQRLNGGDGVSGPAAGRLIRSARSAARFEGMFLGKPEIRALLHEPEFQVFDNPDAFLTCNKDPAKALCDPDRATRAPKDTRPPSLDRCNPACANIAPHRPAHRRRPRRSRPPAPRRRRPTHAPTATRPPGTTDRAERGCATSGSAPRSPP